MRRYGDRVGFALVAMTLAIGSTDLSAGTGLTGFGVDPNPPPTSPPSTSTPHVILPVSTRQLLTIPVGSEFCGIDDIFFNGFESPTFTPVTQLPGGAASLGLTADITGGGTLSVSVSTTGSTSDASVDVTGTFTGPVNTGIAVNGVAGFTAAGKFVVPNVPLASGTNTLSVVATTLPGATATASGSITQSGTATPIVVAVDRTLGYSTFTEKFNYIIGPLAGNATISSLAIDFKGVGTNDYSGSLASAPTSFAYTQTGLYNAQFKFTDSNSVVYTIHRAILVQDTNVQQNMLCDVYGYLKDRLNAQDANGAANVFQPAERSSYLTFFNGLGSDMPNAALQMGFILNGMIATDFAELLLVRDNTTTQLRSGYPLRMTQSGDGVWRISEM